MFQLQDFADQQQQLLLCMACWRGPCVPLLERKEHHKDIAATMPNGIQRQTLSPKASDAHDVPSAFA